MPTTLDVPTPALRDDADSAPTHRPRATVPPRLARSGHLVAALAQGSTVVDLANRRRGHGRPVRPSPVDPERADPTPSSDPTAVCCTIVRSTFEVLRGQRPAAQLARWVSADILATLHQRARLTARIPGPTSTRPVTIMRTRTLMLGERATEATVIVEDDGRVRAAAIRLEAIRGSWHAVALELA